MLALLGTSSYFHLRIYARSSVMLFPSILFETCTGDIVPFLSANMPIIRFVFCFSRTGSHCISSYFSPRGFDSFAVTFTPKILCDYHSYTL